MIAFIFKFDAQFNNKLKLRIGSCIFIPYLRVPEIVKLITLYYRCSYLLMEIATPFE